jgi:hypothetical protein
MATVVPPNPPFPQNPITPVAGSHTSTTQAGQLAASVNTSISQINAYLGQSGTTTVLVPGTDRSYGTIYQNTKPNPIWVKVVGSVSGSGGTEEGFIGENTPPTQEADESSATPASGPASTSIMFAVPPNWFYKVTTDFLTLILWNEIDF